jgi:AmmeMemoRadiSam system protein A
VLVGVAEDAIRAVLEGRRWDPDPAVYAAELRAPWACFVTLLDGGRLLGCVGVLEPELPLVSAVADRARQAAFADPRFPPITADEFVRATIEVSVLGPSEPVHASSLHELLGRLRPGEDGVVVSAPGHRATFLPDVWTQLPLPEDFVDALWRKAGLRTGTWPPGIRVSRYRTETAVGRPPRTAPDPIPVTPAR